MVAVVTAAAATSVTATAENTGTTGWTKQFEVFNTTGAGTKQVAVAVWTKIAGASEAAPAFTSTLSGTAAMTCTLYELSGANTLSLVDTNGTESSSGSGTSSATITSTAVTTSGNVTSAGEFAIMVACRERAAGTPTVTGSGSWTLDVNDGSTSSVSHTGIQSYASPPSGSTLAGTITWSGTGTTAFGAGLTVVFNAGPQAPGVPMAVTATQGGAAALGGMALTVRVVTGAADNPVGATASSYTVTSPELAITPQGTGSLVYGAVCNYSADTLFSSYSNSIFSQNSSDTSNLIAYGAFRSSGTTTASTPVTLGAAAPTVAGGGDTLGVALCEILAGASAVLADDKSSPPPQLFTTSATTITTATFTPPPGSLLVAMVEANALTTGATTMTVQVSDSLGLTWTAQSVAATDAAVGGSFEFASVWTARVPAAPADQMRPVRARLPQQPLLRGRVASNPGAPVQNPPPLYSSSSMPAIPRTSLRARRTPPR